MAARPSATPDRQGRVLLLAVVVMAALIFIWLVVGLVQSALAA